MRISDIHSSSALSRSRMPFYPGYLPPPPIPALESQWALFLDVDGTLLDIAATPDSVKIPDGLVDLLGRLHRRLGGALALISGRRIQKLDQLFKPLSLPAVGLHGFEWRDSSGQQRHSSINTTALHAMRAAAQKLADKIPVLIEDKTFSIAFHFRKARQHEPLLRNAVETIAQSTGFVVQKGIDVYELRPPGPDKSEALTRLMRDYSFHHRLPIYIGDDITDENALATAQRLTGIGIHVGATASNAARFSLSSPGAVLHWLHRWEEQLS